MKMEIFVFIFTKSGWGKICTLFLFMSVSFRVLLLSVTICTYVAMYAFVIMFTSYCFISESLEAANHIFMVELYKPL